LLSFSEAPTSASFSTTAFVNSTTPSPAASINHTSNHNTENSAHSTLLLVPAYCRKHAATREPPIRRDHHRRGPQPRGPHHREYTPRPTPAPSTLCAQIAQTRANNVVLYWSSAVREARDLLAGELMSTTTQLGRSCVCVVF
jgi:hypothetical protein